MTDGKPELFRFERAYALYRMQRERDAQDLLKDADDEDRAVIFLQAQIVGLLASKVAAAYGVFRATAWGTTRRHWRHTTRFYQHQTQA